MTRAPQSPTAFLTAAAGSEVADTASPNVRGVHFVATAPARVPISVIPIRGEHLADVLRPLGQKLPVQLIACPDDVEQIRSPLRINLVVEHVGKRCTKHPLPTSMLRLK
jgi:hypothetical protein